MAAQETSRNSVMKLKGKAWGIVEEFNQCNNPFIVNHKNKTKAVVYEVLHAALTLIQTINTVMD